MHPIIPNDGKTGSEEALYYKMFSRAYDKVQIACVAGGIVTTSNAFLAVSPPKLYFAPAYNTASYAG